MVLQSIHTDHNTTMKYLKVSIILPSGAISQDVESIRVLESGSDLKIEMKLSRPFYDMEKLHTNNLMAI